MKDQDALLDAVHLHLLEKNLHSPSCLLWPDCGCHDNLVHWQQALGDDDRVFTMEQIEWAEEVIFYTCACVAHHCPDREVKAYCARQLANLTRRRERIAAQAQAQGARANAN